MPKRSRRGSSGSRSNGGEGRTGERKLSDSDLEDNVLVSMVTTWINDGGGDDANQDVPNHNRKRAKAETNDSSHNRKDAHDATRTEEIYSVHLTQIPFSATDMDIREHFVAKGILIKSLRMVYDRGVDGRRQFRGVAFLDLSDKESYNLSLSLHKSVMQGRKINVRPTKSKEELTDIVAATQQRVAAKIRKHKDEKDALEGRPRPPSRNREAAQRRIERKQRRKLT